MDSEVDPPQLILTFISEQPPTVRGMLYGQIAFLLMFLLPEEIKDRLIGESEQVGEEYIKWFLSQTHEGGVGALVMIVSLIDFTLSRAVKAHETAADEFKEELTKHAGNLELLWRYTRVSAEKWFELREGVLSPEALDAYADRATATPEPEPIVLQGYTEKP